MRGAPASAGLACAAALEARGLRVAVGSVVFLVAAFVCHVLSVTVCPSLITIYVSQLRETGTGPELRVRSATARPAPAAPRLPRARPSAHRTSVGRDSRRGRRQQRTRAQSCPCRGCPCPCWLVPSMIHRERLRSDMAWSLCRSFSGWYGPGNRIRCRCRVCRWGSSGPS